MTATSRQREQLRALLGPVVAAQGVDLDDLTVQQAGRRSLVRVIVDADGGVDLDAVAKVSRAIDAALESPVDGQGASLFAGPYVLEVSSPGVDRPLVEPRHWRRAIGRLVTVTIDGNALTARVVAADEHGVSFAEVSSGTAPDGPVAHPRLGAGRVQVEFRRPGETDLDPEPNEAELDEAPTNSDTDSEQQHPEAARW